MAKKKKRPKGQQSLTAPEVITPIRKLRVPNSQWADWEQAAAIDQDDEEPNTSKWIRSVLNRAARRIIRKHGGK